MIKDGRPYTTNPDCPGEVDDRLITDYTEEQQKAVQEWIKSYIAPSRATNNHESKSSYGLKHRFEDSIQGGFYMTNNAFKDAMMRAGYMPVDENEVNWRYRIKVATDKSEDSKAPLLQQVLTPSQRKSLATFVMGNFPSAIIRSRSAKAVRYEFIGLCFCWHISYVRKKVCIMMWDTRQLEQAKEGSNVAPKVLELRYMPKPPLYSLPPTPRYVV